MKVKLHYSDKTINVTAKSFGVKIAKAMTAIKSSHVYFIVQQAYGEIDWSEVEKIFEAVLRDGANRKK